MGWLCDLFSVLRVYVCEYIFVCGYAIVGFAVMYVVDVCTQVCLCSNSFLSLSRSCMDAMDRTASFHLFISCFPISSSNDQVNFY
jgi:hypothetical protein